MVGTVIHSPIGPLTLEATATGLRRVRFGTFEVVRLPSLHVEAAALQLSQYFAGRRRAFGLTLDISGTPFQLGVWALLNTIPYGETRTYGELAERLGDRRLARAVGRANSTNPVPIVWPCHRVIGQSGKLTGFRGGLNKKAFLLNHERRAAQPTLFQA